jgi:ribosomal protein S18 acetylase RimI-like enzyme
VVPNLKKSSKGKPRIKYVHGDEALLDEIQALWESLNVHHLGLSVDFKQYYRDLTFQQRKAVLLKKAKNARVRVDLAIDESSGRSVGFIVSSVNEERIGEIESMFVDEKLRGCGIGDALVKRVLAWMEEKGAESKIVEVAAGNEQAFSFYKQYGFLPRETVLKHVLKR